MRKQDEIELLKELKDLLEKYDAEINVVAESNGYNWTVGLDIFYSGGTVFFNTDVPRGHQITVDVDSLRHKIKALECIQELEER